MVLRYAAYKAGRQVFSLNSWTRRGKCFLSRSNDLLPISRITRESSNPVKDEIAKEIARCMLKKQQAHKEARALDKDFFVSVLYSAVTKRDAKSYIQRFSPRTTHPSNFLKENKFQAAYGVNLGGFYGPAAVTDCPKFMQKSVQISETVTETQFHISLVKLRAPQLLTDTIIAGIGRTLSQLGRLGLTSIVVLDYFDKNGPGPVLEKRGPSRRELETQQANRILSAIEKGGEIRARLVDNAIGIDETFAHSGYHTAQTYIALPNLLLNPLRKGAIPVLQPVGYTNITQTALAVAANDVILTLARELSGPPLRVLSNKDPVDAKLHQQPPKQETSLDRLVLLDPLGGIPTKDLPTGYHVFLNMEQEYEPVKQSLLQDVSAPTDKNSPPIQLDVSEKTEILNRKPFSMVVDTPSSSPEEAEKTVTLKPVDENLTHLENLKLVRSVLSILPQTSSAILTSPEEVANSINPDFFEPVKVGTRRQLNPLIHNLLTDKPAFSSSLPVSRRGKQPLSSRIPCKPEIISPITFAKHGMPVIIHPNPKLSHWTPPTPEKIRMSLTNHEIDLPRLKYLIEDSFSRSLDVPAYLNRVNDRIAGVIIAGSYEGGAILTWETPPSTDTTDTTRMVPYLDKFAVLQRSQGTGGVADLIFNAMVRDCFPQGVVWRSRNNNPVNKWYFERSRGSWKIPYTDWTMFWTTPEATMTRQLLQDYESVCREIVSSWADK